MNLKQSNWPNAITHISARPLLRLANLLILSVLITVQCLMSKAFADTDSHYMIDDDNLSESYWSTTLPDKVTKFYETTLPDFFSDDDNEPKISLSIQQMDETTHPSLMDDEKQEVIKLFEGDPLDKKALVIEVPLD